MKNELSTIGFFLLFALIFVFCSNSCTALPEADRFKYTESRFETDVHGNIDGCEISAHIISDPAADDAESRVTAVFSSPDSLSGLVVTQLQNGRCTARLRGVEMESINGTSIIEPFLLLCTRHVISSVNKSDNGDFSVFVSGDDTYLMYSFAPGEDAPYRISGEAGGRAIELYAEKYDFEKN